MILNNYRTVRWLRENRQRPMSIALLFDIHRRIADRTLDEADVARFRRPDEDIRVYDDRDGELIHTPPAASELESRIAPLCEFANAGDDEGAFLHPVIRAIVLHFWLACDHPFVDGNGRAARALFYRCMLNRGYWLFEYLSVSSVIVNAPAKYVRAFLFTETDECDTTYFIHYNVEAIRRSREELNTYLIDQRKRSREMAVLLQNFSGINHRQKTLLEHAIRHADATYTIESHRSSHDIAYETARSDLMDLSKRGLLVEHKSGKRYEYSVPTGFRDRLRTIDAKTPSVPVVE